MKTLDKMTALHYRMKKLKGLIFRLQKQLESESAELKNLKLLYDQERLSDITKNGLKSDETIQWWMNRY